MKLMRAFNPNIVPMNSGKRTTLCDITKEKFLVYDPLVAKIMVFIYNSIKCIITTVFCLTPSPSVSPLP